ncbi:universal stress protein [Natronobiforma cellulositropha]|uniref:universal stress protein n=1 Tax=Natronobiforma cellulositropha TaxID=1679076 RepID=UPI0021D5FC60|nr:universal stress protein [Natronobiforma cellulositropha]
MYDRVLVPTDGSDATADTLAHALPIASANDATVHALSVVDTRITAAADEDTRADLEATLETETERAIAEVVDAATEAGLETVGERRRGVPAKTILTYAEEEAVDLIVIGTRGKSPREKLTTLGSVSERVVDNASVPVLVVRDAGR